MGIEVRAIRDDEFVDWVLCSHVAFHSSRSAQEEADFHRERRGADLDFSRLLGALEDGKVVGTYESFPTQLTLPGENLDGQHACVPANAVSSVSVLPTHHRRGLLRQMISADLTAARDRGDVASILIAAEYPIYGRFGFGPATEHVTYRLLTAHAKFPRAAAGQVQLVEPARMLSIAPKLFEEFRRLRPGQISRRAYTWETRVGARTSPWRTAEQQPLCAVYFDASNQPRGYLLYRVEGDWQDHVPTGRLEINELVALDPDAYLGLWRYCAEVDLVSDVTAELRPLDEPLAWMLADARKALREEIRSDFLWLRPLDTPKLLESRRYVTPGSLIFEVDDPLQLAGGRFKLEAGPHGVTCRPTQESAELRMTMSALGAIVLGGVSLGMLATAGQLEEARPGALETAARLFRWPSVPWCSTFF